MRPIAKCVSDPTAVAVRSGSSKRIWPALLACLLFGFVHSQADATVLVPVTERELTSEAELIFQGVVVREPGLIVTAAHVVAKAVTVSVRDHGGTRHPAKIVAVDPDADLALLRVAAALEPIGIAPERPATGTHVCIIANAFGLDLSITCGIVSARARSGIGFNRIEDFIQTDAAANPGASGGALVDEEGRLVGLVSAIFTKESDANAGVNFAVSGMLLERRIDRMLAGE